MKLISKDDNILGCPVNFPDTAFFDENGRISMIIKNDKEGFLTYTTNEVKLRL